MVERMDTRKDVDLILNTSSKCKENALTLEALNHTASKRP